jgi:hypothetical protein
MDIFEIIATFVALGIYVFGLFYCWYRHLVTLANRYDIPERRRRAAKWYPIVALLFVAPTLAALFCSVRAIPTSTHLIAGILVFSIAPGVIWWIRKMPSLSALGYGRQK